jgi:hypothetical protein
VIDHHDNGNLGPDTLDLIGDGYTVREAKVVFENNGIHWPRHENPQTIGTRGSSCQLITVFRQQPQLSRISVYAQQSAVGSHTAYIQAGFQQFCSKLLKLRT